MMESLSWNKWEQREKKYLGKNKQTKLSMVYGKKKKTKPKAGELDVKRAQGRKGTKSGGTSCTCCKILTKSRNANWLGTLPRV